MLSRRIVVGWAVGLGSGIAFSEPVWDPEHPSVSLKTGRLESAPTERGKGRIIVVKADLDTFGRGTQPAAVSGVPTTGGVPAGVVVGSPVVPRVVPDSRAARFALPHLGLVARLFRSVLGSEDPADVQTPPAAAVEQQPAGSSWGGSEGPWSSLKNWLVHRWTADAATTRRFLLYALLLYLVAVAVLCMFYLASSQTAVDVEFLPRDGFSDELTDCCAQPNICMASFCCPFARWSDTVSKVGLLQFNAGVFFWIVCGLLDLAFLFPAGLLLLLLLGASHRMRIRAFYRLPQQGFGDLLAWVLCMPCAIAQEARHVERAEHIRGALKATPRSFFNSVRDGSPTRMR